MSNLIKGKLSAIRELVEKRKKESCEKANQMMQACIQQRSIVLDMLRLSNREAYGSYVTNKSVYKIYKNLVYDGKKVSVADSKIIIANLIMEDVKELGRSDFIDFFQKDIRALIAASNNMLKVAKKNLSREQVPNFSDEKSTSQRSAANNIARIANNFKGILSILDGYKRILSEYCEKPKLAKSIDGLYDYIKNVLVPCFESLSKDVGSFFDNVNKTGDYNLVLQDKKLQGTTNTVKKFNVAKDEYTR